MRYTKFFAFLVSVFILASCGNKKNVARTEGGNPMLEKEVSLANIVQAVNAKRVNESCLTAKINLSISTARKSVRMGGSLKMKRNDVIQISLVAMGLMEVGRLELTPDYMMVVDRINHQYVKSGYTEVDFFREAGIDFFTFQSLFWDELFVLNSKGEAPSGSNYSLKTDAAGTQLINSKDSNVALSFLINAVNQLVGETRFSREYSEDTVLKWQYADWTKLGVRDFPGSMKISFDLPNDSVEAVFKITNVKTDADWEPRTEINKNRYSEVSLDAAFKKIMSLAQ
jgi:hypothetical protein